MIFHNKEKVNTKSYLPKNKDITRIILTSGASCPDTLVDEVLDKVLAYFDTTISKEDILQNFKKLEES